MLSDIKWYDKNNKDHPRQQIDLLKKMITEYGYDSPIIVNKDWIVIAGHWRLLALKELAEEWNKDYLEVEVIKKDKLTKKQEQKYRLLDNKISELATSNPDNIKLELEELEDLELNELYPEIDLKEIELDEANEDTVPEPQKEAKLVKVGDIFQLGNHRIMCGDSTVKEDVDKLMDGKKADMVFTDPPYWVNYTWWIQFTKEWVKKNQRQWLIDDQIDTDIYTKVVPIICEYTTWPVYMWFSDTHALSVYLAVETQWQIHALIIWVKNGWYAAMNANYKQKHEPCLYWKPKDNILNFVWPTTETTIREMNKDGINKLHPTQKPITLAERAINNHKAESVLDLFLWSWSTLIACEKTNRICYWMELDPVYIEVILKRYHDYTKWAREIKCLNRDLDLNSILNG
jgi:DNA modification methylase